MPGGHNSLFISRTLLQLDHHKLRDNMDRFNRALPDVTLQWRRLGQVGVMLVQAAEYNALTQIPRSRLHAQPAQKVAKELNDGFLKGRDKTPVALLAADFLGHNTAEYVHIGFSVDPEGPGRRKTGAYRRTGQNESRARRLAARVPAVPVIGNA